MMSVKQRNLCCLRKRKKDKQRTEDKREKYRNMIIGKLGNRCEDEKMQKYTVKQNTKMEELDYHNGAQFL